MLLTVKDLVRRLQVKPSTVYAWAVQGKIPALKVNGVLRFDSEDIGPWLNGCRLRQGKPFAASKRPVALSDVDALVERAKQEVYSGRHGETRPDRALTGKEE